MGRKDAKKDGKNGKDKYGLEKELKLKKRITHNDLLERQLIDLKKNQD